MWDFFSNLIKEAKGVKGKKIATIIIIALIIFMIVYPYVDANFLYFNRVEKRIRILDEVANFDTNSISNNEQLKREYESILQEIEQQNQNNINSIVKKEEDKNTTMKKFVSGGILWWILMLVFVFVKDKNEQLSKGKKILNKIGGFIICGIFGIFSGYIASIIPTIINPWFNYIGFPIILIILLSLIFYKSK